MPTDPPAQGVAQCPEGEDAHEAEAEAENRGRGTNAADPPRGEMAIALSMGKNQEC